MQSGQSKVLVEPVRQQVIAGQGGLLLPGEESACKDSSCTRLR